MFFFILYYLLQVLNITERDHPSSHLSKSSELCVIDLHLSVHLHLSVFPKLIVSETKLN